MSDRRKVLEQFELQKEYTEKRVNDGIEKYRKTDVCITFKDKEGNSIKNTEIKVNQINHEFKYGSNLFMLDELETDEKNAKYREIMSTFGNMATLPFYWDATEPEKGKTRYSKDSKKVYRRPPIDLCVEFCEKYGIEPREHALAYDNFFPKWLYDATTDEVKIALEKRYSQISEKYADKIPTIEVTNEMEWGEGKTVFYDQPDYVEWCFKKAEEYFPNNQLVINEHTGLCWGDRCRATDKYYSYIEANMLKGARIDAIGMQYHVFCPREDEFKWTADTLYSPKNLYRHMDLYSNFGKPLQITEITVPSYSWESEDEEIQAEIIENLYKIWFSHPNVEQIIYWNMIDGYAHLWDPDPEKIKASQGNMQIGENYHHGGLLRFDLSPKPAYFTIKNLFEKVWHTSENLISNENGKISFRGFYGKYEIIVNGKVFNVNLSKNSDKNIIIEV
nr:endo-1,4-beta-xylanase [uncultured bacterium]